MNPFSPSSQEDHDAWLTLSLSLPQPQPQPQQTYFWDVPTYPPAPLPSPLPPPMPKVLPKRKFASQEKDVQDQETTQSRVGRRARKSSNRAVKEGKSETVSPPYPWATSTRATVHTLDHLLSKNMMSITGAVQCKRCDEKYDIEFDLKEKFNEVAGFLARNRYDMRDRAPRVWTSPLLPTCNRCGQQDSLKPVITKKRTTNWLFLLLGQMIGCCNLSHLKYFCKHTKNHRTGAKDRLVYLTYLGLCKQLNPDGTFDV